jgi:uncharacterized MAPEG superfamily protein
MTIAIWCILVAAILPYVSAGFVRGLDRNEPRGHLAALEPRSVRAYGAQLNAFETFPIFAASVIVAHMVGGPSRFADITAILYILCRVGHMSAYIARNQPLRSLGFTLGQAAAVAIFVSPLFR